MLIWRFYFVYFCSQRAVNNSTRSIKPKKGAFLSKNKNILTDMLN